MFAQKHNQTTNCAQSFTCFSANFFLVPIPVESEKQHIVKISYYQNLTIRMCSWCVSQSTVFTKRSVTCTLVAIRNQIHVQLLNLYHFGENSLYNMETFDPMAFISFYRIRKSGQIPRHGGVVCSSVLSHADGKTQN